MSPERIIALHSIKRFKTIPVMSYRTTLIDHYRSVVKLLNDLTPVVQEYFPQYRPGLARAIACVHDDPELITGDVPTNVKERMTYSEKIQLEQHERVAIRRLSYRFASRSERLLYRWLMRQASEKVLLEAQIVSVADKIDGFGEAFREILCGNQLFLSPASEYIRRVNSLPCKLPLLEQMFRQSEHPLVQPVPPLDVFALLQSNMCNQRKSTGIVVYDEWRRIKYAY